MANIFNFPPKAGRSDDKDFVTDESELVQFDTPGWDASIAGTTRQPSVQKSSRDWTNQELASIYRVKRLLDAAGVPNHVERSLSDEGDPWCVFCTEAGDVFIHLCRIGGVYTLDSPNLSDSISGVDFNDLVTQFSKGALRDSENAAKARRRLIKLERGGKVFLHPAAILAALIWSIYLKSEDIVILMPDDENQNGFDDEVTIELVKTQSEALDADDASAEAHFIQSIATQNQMISTELPQVSNEDSFSTRPLHLYKDLIAKSGLALAPSAVAVGLSSIAIAYGFMSESYFNDEPEMQVGVDLNTTVESAAQLAELGPSNPSMASAQVFEQITALDAGFDHAMPEQPVEDAAVEVGNAAEIKVDSLLKMALAMPNGSSATDFGSTPDLSNDGPLLSRLSIPEDLVPPDGPDQDVIVISSDSPDDTSVPNTLPKISAMLSMVDLHEAFSTRLAEITTISREIDLDLTIANLAPGTGQTMKVTLFRDMQDGQEATEENDVEPLLKHDSSAFIEVFYASSEADVFDRKALSFFEYLMAKDASQLLSRYTENSIELIDLSVWNTPGEAAGITWTLEHGDTVELVGLKSDFQEFGLIA